MTEAAKQPSTATRRPGGSQATPNGDGPRSEHDLRSEQDLVGDRDDGNKQDDRDERNERVERYPRDEQRTERGEQDLRRKQSRAGDRDERDPRDTRGEQWHSDRGELGDGREPGGVQRTLEQVTDRVRAATSNPGDAFATTPDMTKVLTAWFDMAGDMMKLQQQFFSSVLGAGNTNDRTTTKV
jgi:hypothetical protein